MLTAILDFALSFGAKVLEALPLFLATAAVFTVLGFFVRSKVSKGPWWRKPDLVTDILYTFLLPGFTSYVRLAFLVIGGGAIGLLMGMDAEAWLTEGHGVFASWPFWAQVAAYVLLSDVMLYWTHRIFHNGRLWRYHAIHHSSEHLDWMSAFRFHPINTIFHSVLVDAILLLAGIPPQVIVFLVPFQMFMSGLVHADVDWDFGPVGKYLLASPVFHRWHHTGVDEGGEKNFAPTFPLIDVVFGSFYMPAGKIPSNFGVDDPHFPKAFEHQMLYPFKEPRKLEPAE